MRSVTILKGLPASGKTTWAKEYVKKNKGSVKRINKDDLRAMLDASEWSKGNEKYILQLRDHIILTSLDLGKSVIVDDTNLHSKHEKRIRELVKEFNQGLHGENYSEKNPVQVKVKFFKIDPKEAIKNDLKRPNSVGAGVIWDMYNKFLKPEEEKIKPLIQDPDLPTAIICDLDGTLAIHVERKAYDYDKCDTDKLNIPVSNLLTSYLEGEYHKGNKDVHVIFLSGREDSCKEKTITWLKKHGLYNDATDLLYMRKTGDHRKDSIIKKEIFDKNIRGNFYVDFILDDRNQVVDMWRKLGLTCLQVADGDF